MTCAGGGIARLGAYDGHGLYRMLPTPQRREKGVYEGYDSDPLRLSCYINSFTLVKAK
jgi:hypothetical protein